MRDPDAVMAYEAEQQELVEGIVKSLYELTHERTNHRVVFGKVSIAILQSLENRRITTKDALVRKSWEKIWPPIRKFVDKKWKATGSKKIVQRKAEYDYLLFKVFEKVFASVSSGIIGAYQAEEMRREYKPA